MSQQSETAETTDKGQRRWGRWIFALAIVAVVALAVTSPRWMHNFRRHETDGGNRLAPATATEGKIPAYIGPSWKELDDPANEGWDTEVFNAKAGKVFKKLSKVLTQSGPIKAIQLTPFLSKTFSCESLLPSSRYLAHQDAIFHVERARLPTGSKPPTKPGQYHGAEGLVKALRDLLAPLAGAKDMRCKFKLFRIHRKDGTIITRQYVAFSGRTSTGMVEQNATWVIRWRDNAPDSLAQIDRINVEEFEQVTTTNSQGPLFADCTRSILDGNACYKKQFLHGMNYWLERMQDTRYFYLFGNPGLAVGDVNGDGLDDLYVCQEEGLPNRLFAQLPDGTAVDISKKWGVDWLHSSRSALLVDLNNDGAQDLVVATVGHLIVASNEGDHFKIRALLRTDEDTMSLCAADYDNDGDLDIYVCVYFANTKLQEKARTSLMSGVTGAKDRSGGRNALFRNDYSPKTDWQFTNVTEKVGLDVENGRFSLAASWEDFDNDGDQDLYVANDYGRNNLYRNDGGKFAEVTGKVGVEDIAFGMSVAWGDYDRDGLMDLYISNMFSAAGNRITFQEKVESNNPKLAKKLQRFARGNTLLRNKGDGTFADYSAEAAVAVGRWAWSSNFVDINNDGWEDLVVANGYLTTEDNGDL